MLIERVRDRLVQDAMIDVVVLVHEDVAQSGAPGDALREVCVVDAEASAQVTPRWFPWPETMSPMP
jgi:hypothetical protein